MAAKKSEKADKPDLEEAARNLLALVDSPGYSTKVWLEALQALRDALDG